MLLCVRHRRMMLSRGGSSARHLVRMMAAAGIPDSRVLGVSHGLYNLRALVPLDPALMRSVGTVRRTA
jgi:hypothetical protein